MRYIYVIIFMSAFSLAGAQDTSIKEVLGFDEYLGFVKKFHPIVKQAELVIDESQAKLLKSRGAFDPKISVDYDSKELLGSDYWDQLNATFKVPTWYGVEFKASFEENTGDFLNPENFIPEGGLYSAGVSLSLAKGFLINDRMAQLKQAKLFREQAKADRDIFVNNILFEASTAYFNWLKFYNELLLFQNFSDNAERRYLGVERGAELGEFAAIDVTEAKIALDNRRLSLEQARIKLMKATLELSTFLWLEKNIPVELQPNVIPDIDTEPIVDAIFNINQLQDDETDIELHPKLRSLDFKLQSLEVERRLKKNAILPRVDLEYNFLSQNPDVARTFNTSDYKGGLKVSLPLFFRKERGDLKLAKIKLKDTEFEANATRVNLLNKINGLRQELDSYVTQNELTDEIVVGSERLLEAEERKFQLGESSLFLVNSRESKLIEVRLKAILIQNKFFNTKAKLFNSLAVNPEL